MNRWRLGPLAGHSRLVDPIKAYVGSGPALSDDERHKVRSALRVKGAKVGGRFWI
jgi:hypothetical protein